MAIRYTFSLSGPGGKTKRGEFFLHEFEWPVDGDGYEWINEKAGSATGELVPSPMLFRRNVESATPRPPTIWYAPVRERPALFRTFADTVATQEGILKFAKKHGMLSESVNGEPLQDWVDRIFAMRSAISLWEMASSRDVQGLRSVIILEAEAISFHPKPAWVVPDWRTEADGGSSPRKRRTAPAGAGLGAERFAITNDPGQIEYARRHGDEGLIVEAFLAIEMIANRYLSGAVASRLVVDLEDGIPALIQEPHELGGALWVQFAQAIENGTRFRRCKSCNEWIALPLRGTRVTREFCSAACRIKAHRGRKDKARRLSAKGKAPAGIARKLDTTVVVVKRWLKSGKG